VRRGAGKDTRRHWRDLVAAWTFAASPYPAAYAAFRLAEASLFGHAPRPDVVAAIRDAHARAAALGATSLADDVARLARHARVSLGAEPRASTDASQGPDGFGLTAREREVLTLVAAGRTNREIARSLFMSESTASVHVSRVLDKLGVRSRVEAATLALRLGIVAATERVETP
jgi:DNA-binding NarL/FixJ family response regulator